MTSLPKSLPEDPIIRQLVAQARKSQLSRRHLLQGAGIGATALALAACAPAGGSAPKPAVDVSDTDKTLTWSNWPAYIDENDDGGYPTLINFQDTLGITTRVGEILDVEGRLGGFNFQWSWSSGTLAGRAAVSKR